MSVMRNKAIKITAIALCVILVVLLIAFATFLVYASDYYRADKAAIEAFSYGGVTEQKEIDDGILAFGDAEAEVGFIFYPGGKVEYTAYIPLMKAIASNGIFCVLIEMPFNLAVLDTDAAEKVIEKYNGISRWYIGGHSLGGSMAASYAAKNSDAVDGVVLLGAYSTAKLGDKGIKVLSVYGSEDGVMNRESYASYLENLPEGFTERVISGANHAGFGMYGRQDGDGTATVTNGEQIIITSEIINGFIKEK